MSIPSTTSTTSYDQVAPILAIESSCDETAVAILEPPQKIVISLVSSQMEEHAKFGGVVPEVASRRHLELLAPLVQEALHKANLDFSQLGAVAATAGPGLAPALLIGNSYAKGVALAANIPYLAVNHLEGHLLSPFSEQATIPEHLGILVSGGHTALYHIPQVGKYRLLGATLDDALGEAFDKVAKLLGLPYPGGAIIDRLALQGDCFRYPFPKALCEKGNLQMSFSGIKTAVRYFLAKEEQQRSSEEFHQWLQAELPHIAASFQEAVLGGICQKISWAMEQEDLKALAISGGVACNSRLQGDLTALAMQEGWDFFLPPRYLVTDNAAMIAFAAIHHLRVGEETAVEQEIDPRWKL